MIAQPPDELKLIRPFIHRGNQMANVDPVITYYCYYWATKLALEKELQTATPECGTYMMGIIQDLEGRKERLSGNDLITDDMAAQAYVENFALKIFNNGNRAIEARKITQSTPDALQAAVVFLELTKIFSNEPDPEIVKKIKYAKFHAARILKALREGEDPNLPPTPLPKSEQSSSPPPSATVEDAPDEYYSVGSKLPDNSMNNSSLHPSKPAIMMDVPSLIPPLDRVENIPSQPEPLELHPSTPSETEGYFPPVPSMNEPVSPGVSAAKICPVSPGINDEHIPPSEPPAQKTPPIIPQPPLYQPLQPQISSRAAVQQHPSTPIPTHTSSQISFQTPHVYRDPRTSQPYIAPPSQPRNPISPEDIAKAQKYAKWAISALDYDDIDNAIEQFRSGLAALGVS
ncbi:Vta1 like-domain-containing protein [Geopyxis carbonaria]|nr:Vta1 like-domain-containing protein [Geopyxis carbonaria]